MKSSHWKVLHHHHMTWLTVTECLCHKWSRTCSLCRNHNQDIFLFRGGSRILSWGGGLKKIAPGGGRREMFWGISCKKSRFYKKKIIFFPILGGTRAGCVPLDPPLLFMTSHQVCEQSNTTGATCFVDRCLSFCLLLCGRLCCLSFFDLMLCYLQTFLETVSNDQHNIRSVVSDPSPEPFHIFSLSL